MLFNKMPYLLIFYLFLRFEGTFLIYANYILPFIDFWKWGKFPPKGKYKKINNYGILLNNIAY